MVVRRRLIAFGLGLLLLAGVVWGRQQQVQSVTILMPAPYADATATLVDRFNADHRGQIHLSVSRGPLETESISDLAISSLLLGSPPFDALLVDVTWLPKYVAAGWLEPLEPWFDAADEQELVAGARLGNRVNGSLYRWPLGADVGLLYWRTDLMADPPTTPDELTAVVSKLQQNGQAPQGFVWQGRQYEGLSCDF
ncbi:MAG: extracellular solute-binding protein, partial [Synechococcus sp. MED-G133]